MWLWLARTINGSNQQVNTNSGADSGSTAMYVLIIVQPNSDECFSQVRLTKAINRLCPKIVGQSHFLEAIQVVGANMIVGRRTFNIVINLGFAGD